MVYNYLAKIGRYSEYNLPIAFFSYIAGGFISTIDRQIAAIAKDAKVHGSAITVAAFIKMTETHIEKQYTHKVLREIFGIDRQIMINDI